VRARRVGRESSLVPLVQVVVRRPIAALCGCIQGGFRESAQSEGGRGRERGRERERERRRERERERERERGREREGESDQKVI
jgi:hypothetical protein